MKTPVMLSLLCALGCEGVAPEGAPAVPSEQSGTSPLTAQQIPTLPSPDVPLTTVVSGFDGLAGNYVRVPYLAPDGEILTASFDVYLSEDGSAEGAFTRLLSEICLYPGCNFEVGDFNATPQNPAIGYAFINFAVQNLDGTVTHDVYVVDAVARNKAGKITYLKLRHVVASGFGNPFFLARTF
jgi:hypothetical protein